MTKTTYMWDELSDNVAAEYDDGVLSAAYTHEPGLYGNLLSQNRNGGTSYYHYDGRGDTVALTDDSGDVTDTKEYDAWGNVIASTGSTVNGFWLGGCHGYYTSLTGVYVRTRIYEPRHSRWMSLDWISPPLGSEYLFGNNSPITQVDASGLFPCKYSHSSCGKFDRITLVNNTAIPNETSVNLVAQWTGGNDCEPLPCRCKEVGFVQVVEYNYVYENKYGFGLNYKKPWHLDAPRFNDGWPYPFPDSLGSSTVDPISGRLLSMSDSPGVPKKHSLGHRLLSIEHNFETCVTCMSTQSPHFDDGTAVAIHTLGCFKWSYVYIYNTTVSPPNEELTRYLSVGGKSKSTSIQKKELQILNADGDSPSRTWQTTVCDGIQSLAHYSSGDPD